MKSVAINQGPHQTQQLIQSSFLLIFAPLGHKRALKRDYKCAKVW